MFTHPYKKREVIFLQVLAKHPYVQIHFMRLFEDGLGKKKLILIAMEGK